MAKVLVTKSLLDKLAQKIATKVGTDETMTIAEMGNAVESIVGGSSEDDLIQRTISGEYTNERITIVGDGSFDRCTSLTSISCPQAEVVGGTAFFKCTSLTSVDLPKATVIGSSAFSGCTALTSVAFPKASTIESYAFAGCSNLQIVDFSAATTIELYTFNSCKALDTIIIRTPGVCSLETTNALNKTPVASGSGYIYVPDELVDSYKIADNWSTYADQIKALSELQ